MALLFLSRHQNCIKTQAPRIICCPVRKEISARAKTEHLGVEISPNFFAWLFTYGNKIDIAYPTVLRTEYQERVEEVLEMLKEKAK